MLGFWLLLDGFAYVILSVVGILTPHHQQTAFLIAQPALFAELPVMLFLLVKGANAPPLTTAAARP